MFTVFRNERTLVNNRDVKSEKRDESEEWEDIPLKLKKRSEMIKSS